jgi:hypothetical protein
MHKGRLTKTGTDQEDKEISSMNKGTVEQWRLLLGEYDHREARIQKLNHELASHFQEASRAERPAQPEAILQQLEIAKMALADVSKRMIRFVREFM